MCIVMVMDEETLATSIPQSPHLVIDIRRLQITRRVYFRSILSSERLTVALTSEHVAKSLGPWSTSRSTTRSPFIMSLATKKDEENGLSTYYNNKTTVIQEARVFNESPISPRKCRAVLTRIVYLLYVGESFNTQEATTLFFGTTKLFQHKDSALRQMVDLTIKELSTSAEDVIMVTSSIMKDMQPNSEVIYRPNAIRALCRIIDPSMVQGVERFFKAAIVDKNPSISSAALVSAYHLFPSSKDVVKRWVNEAQEAVTAKSSSSLFGGSPSPASYLGWGSSSSGANTGYQPVPSSSYITQYHALGLLYLIRQQDRMAVTKMIQQLGGGKSGAGTTLKNAMALCMLIRYAAKVMEEDPNVQRQMLDLLEGWLRHKSDMVNLEAARVICEMKNVTAAQLTRPIAVIPVFTKVDPKFAATRTLASLALSHPASVATCNIDLENLISDQNRSVATYAITTLLKARIVIRLLLDYHLTSIIDCEISDEFKVIIVDAIRSLCLKFPAKHESMLSFLSGVLRDEGGYDFKRAVVEAIFDMIKFIGDCKEQALSHLCEFIEDCEFTKLSVRILHLLGVEGPKAPHPTKYIRFIYNRVVLENATVRAAAVSSLAKFGLNSFDDKLGKSINVLLHRCLDDVDDEVRDRAAMYLKVYDEPPLVSTYIKEESMYSLSALESQLVSYISDPEALAQPFDASSIPKISREQAAKDAARPSPLDTIGVPSTSKAATPPPPSAAETQSAYGQQLAEVPELASYGPVLNSSSTPAQLTESETEYRVSCVKHIFKEHIVFQFNVSNTIPDTLLEGVSVIMQPQADSSGLTEDFIIPVPTLTADTSPGIIYVSFTRDTPEDYAMASFQCILKFVSKELDPSTGEPEEDGYDDEYQLEETELAAADYIVPSYVTFASEWDRMRGGASATETFSLSAMESMKAACTSIIDILHMQPLGGTEDPQNMSVHTLQLSGLVAGGGGKVLVRCRMTYSKAQGVTLELGVRRNSRRRATWWLQRSEADGVPSVVVRMLSCSVCICIIRVHYILEFAEARPWAVDVSCQARSSTAEDMRSCERMIKRIGVGYRCSEGQLNMIVRPESSIRTMYLTAPDTRGSPSINIMAVGSLSASSSYHPALAHTSLYCLASCSNQQAPISNYRPTPPALATMSGPSLPTAKTIQVDTRGAQILDEESPETRDSRGIYLPNYIEPVSHIAVDIGGSLAKVVYFTRSTDPPSSPSQIATRGSSSASSLSTPLSASPGKDSPLSTSPPPKSITSITHTRLNGVLTPAMLDHNGHNGHNCHNFLAAPNGPNAAHSHNASLADDLSSRSIDHSALHDSLLRRASVQHFPGGSLNFERFETEHIDECVAFIRALIERSAAINDVPIEEMRRGVKVIATGGGAQRFYELFRRELLVEVRREDEMECLIEGLKFIALIPHEVYYFSDELIHSVSHPASCGVFERPSPDPPKYAVTFVEHPAPQLPCLLVNIGSGVSLIKVDEDGSFERVSGTSLGGGTLWGLLSLLTPASTFDGALNGSWNIWLMLMLMDVRTSADMLELSEQGDNATVDMLVGDIYGQDYSKLGLKSTMIASSFGKVFKKSGGKKGTFKAEDISKSLLYAISNNIGQIAYMNAEKYNLDRIYFGGYFIRGHAATISTLSYAIRFWSKGTKRALFLRHEGFLGSIGAWIKNIGDVEQEVGGS
ncbi:putative coatomer subunit gamma [Grifola frondosa]|uniref:Gamma-coat protein n=1 Tax=Grifola frondosa TaxID=5627 RepID=A0A1C7MRZ9_GRIFR|nr:putative coatomer subunit gamma [Grifola frondosa]